MKLEPHSEACVTGDGRGTCSRCARDRACLEALAGVSDPVDFVASHGLLISALNHALACSSEGRCEKCIAALGVAARARAVGPVKP